jgi:L-aspartate oxidase
MDVETKIDLITVPVNIPDWNADGTIVPREQILITHSIKALKDLMSDYVAIVRSNERLESALRRVRFLHEEIERLYNKAVLSPQLCELRNLITIAHLIIVQSLDRKDNRGGFYNVDLDDSKTNLIAV